LGLAGLYVAADAEDVRRHRKCLKSHTIAPMPLASGSLSAGAPLLRAFCQGHFFFGRLLLRQ